MTNHPSSQQKREELDKAVTEVFAEMARSYDEANIWAQRKKVLALFDAWHQQEIAEATVNTENEMILAMAMILSRHDRIEVMKTYVELHKPNKHDNVDNHIKSAIEEGERTIARTKPAPNTEGEK